VTTVLALGAVGAVGAVLLWWFGTGALLYLHGLPRRTFRWTFAASTAAFVLALVGLWWCADRPGPAAAVLSFVCGFLAWSWQEVGFYTGYVTGPRKETCPEGCRGLRHFGHALSACLWHEIGIVVSAGLVALATSGGAQRTGLWTFLLMWLMHESARLNVLLGVRNVNADFLPDHLDHIRGFLRRTPAGNRLFGWSVAGSLALAGVLTTMAAGASGAAASTGRTLLATMAWIGVLEHALLMAPLPQPAFWVESREAARRVGETAQR